MEVSVRDRLGGRRAISWQAVAIGDALIVVLATTLAALSPGDRRPIDAAVDFFAITMATAVLVACYAALAHVTVFKNRSRSPIPVPVAVGFHLSIGVIFLLGFAVGAMVLAIPPLGGGPFFSVAVLLGGLSVCVPASLLLDHSDRYRERRAELLSQLADQERLGISEWSLRRSLRDLCASVSEGNAVRDATERLDALDLSDPTRLSLSQWWGVSQGHHAGEGADFEAELDRRIAEQFPIIRWSRELARAPRTRPSFPAGLAALSILMVWLFLTPVTSSSVAAPIAVISATGVYVWFAKLRCSRSLPTAVSWISVALWSAGVTFAWVAGSGGGGDVGFVAIIAFLAAAGVMAAVFLASLVTAVTTTREGQLRTVERAIARRRDESAAIVSSMAAIVAGLAGVPPLADSTAVAACATGLARLRPDVDAQYARRILDWTESIVSAPGLITPVTIQDRIEDTVHPWRALAEISVDCALADVAPELADDIVAVIDEAVRNACRHGEAEHVEISVTVGSDDGLEIVVLDDGTGPGDGHPGVGFERYATVATGGFEVTGRDPLPGTCARMRIL